MNLLNSSNPSGRINVFGLEDEYKNVLLNSESKLSWCDNVPYQRNQNITSDDIHDPQEVNTSFATELRSYWGLPLVFNTICIEAVNRPDRKKFCDEDCQEGSSNETGYE